MAEILVLTREIPLPVQATGTSLRINPIVRYLAREHAVHLAALGDIRPEAPRLAEEARSFCTTVWHTPRRPLRRPRRWMRTARALMDPSRPPWEAVDPYSHEQVKLVERCLRETRTDVMLVIGGAMDATTRLITRGPRPPRVVVDWVDAPSLLYERQTSASTPLRRWIRDYRTDRLRTWQRFVNARVEASIYIADFDRAHAGESDNPSVHVVGNGVLEVDGPLPARRGGPPTLGFLGNMAYDPNVQAALRLHARIFRPLAERIPDLRLKIIGRDPVPEVQNLASNRVEITGEVDSIWPHLADVDLMVFPMELGGGLQNKVLEAVAGGCAVVVTQVGAAGTGRVGLESLVIEDTDQGMIAAARRLLEDPEAMARARERSRALLREFNWSHILPRYAEIVLGS